MHQRKYIGRYELRTLDKHKVKHHEVYGGNMQKRSYRQKGRKPLLTCRDENGKYGNPEDEGAVRNTLKQARINFVATLK